jgi:hypothetical protein
LKHDDSPDEVEKAMAGLPMDLAAPVVIGWDREQGFGFDI